MLFRSVEAANKERQPYSKERLKELLSRHHKWNASVMIERILKDVKQYSEQLNDDVTILAIDVLRPF